MSNYKASRPMRTRQISPQISKCSSNANLIKQRTHEKTTVSHSQLPSAHSLGLDQPLPPKAIINRVNTSTSSLTTDSPRRYTADQTKMQNKLADLLKSAKSNNRLQII